MCCFLAFDQLRGNARISCLVLRPPQRSRGMGYRALIVLGGHACDQPEEHDILDLPAQAAEQACLQMPARQQKNEMLLDGASAQRARVDDSVLDTAPRIL